MVGLTDKSVHRRIANLSRNKTVEEKEEKKRKEITDVGIEKLRCATPTIPYFSTTARKAFCNTGSLNGTGERPVTALEKEAVFVVTNWASKDASKYKEELEFLSCCISQPTVLKYGAPEGYVLGSVLINYVHHANRAMSLGIATHCTTYLQLTRRCTHLPAPSTLLNCCWTLGLVQNL